MSKFINIIDSSGFYIRPEIVSDDTPLTSTMIETPCPSGFYKPKWDSNAWVEGMTQAEIDAIPDASPVSLEEQVAAMANSIIEQQDSIDAQMDALRIIMTETIPSMEV